MNSLSMQHLCILSIYVFFICEFYPLMVEYTGDKMHTPSKGACKWGGGGDMEVFSAPVPQPR